MAFISKGMNQGFVINLAFKEDAIGFEPTFKQFRDQLCLLYDFIIDACRQSPRLETLLYQDYVVTNRVTLRVCLVIEQVFKNQSNLISLPIANMSEAFVVSKETLK